MSELNTTKDVHLAGEGEFTLPPAGGRLRRSVKEDTLTPYGGLVRWAAYTKHVGIVENLAASCPARRTSTNASPVYDVLQSFMLTARTDGRRFIHIERLREDPTIPELFGIEAVVSDDTVRRLFRTIPPETGAEWIARNAKPMWAALPDRIIMDWDSTVRPNFGHQEGAEGEYNPGRRGRRSVHPLLGVVADTRPCPAYRFRRGDREVWRNRGDLGRDHDAVMIWREEVPRRPRFLSKLKLASCVRKHFTPSGRISGTDRRFSVRRRLKQS